MAEQPSKADINAIFKRLRSIPTNKQCFDCSHSNPTWASVTYGVFLCIDCSAVHRSLGVHVTFIRSTQLDTSWTWLQLRAMQVGGNANAISYFRQHGCDTNDAQKKYNSRAAMMYKEKLLGLSQHACRLHGTKLHIDAGHSDPSPVSKEVDFFKEHTEFNSRDTQPSPINEEARLYSEPQPIKNGSLSSKAVEIDPNEGPNVEAALSMSPTQAAAIAEPRKAIIGGKKAPAGKKGKGFGAQRVKTNFSEIENRAQQLDKEREELAKATAVQEARTKEEQDKQVASMRLAYKDMSLQRQKQEEKLKAADPKKAEQFERLGMGFAGSKGISHSAISDMQTIQQEGLKESRNERNNRRRDFFDEEMDMMGGRFSSSSSRYGDRYDDNSYGSKRDDFGSWGNPNKGGSWDIDRFDSKSSSSDKFSSKDEDSSKKTYSETSSSSSSSKSSADAQKRFGNSKAISSDQYFGNNDMDFEVRQNLSRLDGKSSISSDDVFGRSDKGSSRGGSSSQYYASPDLQDIRDGVKQGVTKVAGKISNLANGVLSSLQDRYGS
ncbi:LOW QUALITY PROTEIN: ADP-ribosylation factor GTPase-activating protein 2-like [Haliotis rubra]|uniref:LOW QUALITY PROTEIN: ADP-ribosylation factor GTPase-activating protein 2-like n=1 Tax=Haliotis rubra TaxID=36100 RepID=UPI001EE60A01|nr:LOW QUALITY PROTEIN: ADP-ribosylation factor GTPase-activating protein 2-like [Haliotis rubra]